jgi:hypothetical protein
MTTFNFTPQQLTRKLEQNAQFIKETQALLNKQESYPIDLQNVEMIQILRRRLEILIDVKNKLTSK